MYMAADAFLNQKPIYGVAFGLETGFYKYSPFTMLLFVPYNLVPFEVASIIHFIIIGITAIFTIILLEKIVSQHFQPKRKKHVLSLFALLVCIINHLVRELHLGNVNMILISLLCLTVYLTLNNRFLIAGVLLSLVILTKPYFLIAVMPLLVGKKFKVVYSTVVSTVIFVLISGIVIGIENSSNLYKEWFAAMMEHNSYLTSSETIFSLAQTYFGITIPNNYGVYLLALIPIASSFLFTIKGGYFSKDALPKDDILNQHFILHFFLLMAIVPSILITDTEHFLLSLPLIAILLFHLPKKSYLNLFLFIILMILYGGNSSDLLGKELANNFTTWGVLGISNLIIVGMILVQFIKRSDYQSSSSDN